ncbi:Uncharacterised protein [BD1-7 clade bacterium]|uniref:Uncharacterized protein n=1 Tax=BD1-7 clade bacterium TaxID=2029982 RepID=A0A5S9PCU9_9GAMM|nr:Uncharacterised protein [BD1-7 clade bacterium]
MNYKALVIHLVIIFAVVTQWHSTPPHIKDVLFYLLYAVLLVQGNYYTMKVSRLKTQLAKMKVSRE